MSDAAKRVNTSMCNRTSRSRSAAVSLISSEMLVDTNRVRSRSKVRVIPKAKAQIPAMNITRTSSTTRAFKVMAFQSKASIRPALRMGDSGPKFGILRKGLKPGWGDSFMPDALIGQHRVAIWDAPSIPPIAAFLPAMLVSSRSQGLH